MSPHVVQPPILVPPPFPTLVQDDLVCLPSKVSASLGHMGPMVLCTKVTNQITLTDPVTLRSTSMDVSVCGGGSTAPSLVVMSRGGEGLGIPWCRHSVIPTPTLLHTLRRCSLPPSGPDLLPLPVPAGFLRQADGQVHRPGH